VQFIGEGRFIFGPALTRGSPEAASGTVPSTAARKMIASEFAPAVAMSMPRCQSRAAGDARGDLANGQTSPSKGEPERGLPTGNRASGFGLRGAGL
jgi:hypothetical protein